jgi:cytochrome c oxidase assembly protein subunit 15
MEEVTSPLWRDTVDPVDDRMMRKLTALTTALIYVQILLGATMRHNDAGLAIPDFPLAFGHLIPPVWNPRIAIHFAHRVGALTVSLVLVATVAHVFYHHPRRLELVRPAIGLLLLVAVQVTLGAFVVLSGKNPFINTTHVVTGALVLGTSLTLTLRCFRIGFERLVQPIRGIAPAQGHMEGARP